MNGEIRLFIDTNGNSVKDAEEEYLRGFQKDAIQLKKVSDIEVYNFKQGWNLVSFPLVPDEFKTVKDLLTEITAHGGYATHVATYRSGKWVLYSQRGGMPKTAAAGAQHQSGRY